MDVVGYILKKTYLKNKKCFSGHESMHRQRKNKNLEKNGTFKNKNIQCPVENKNKRFNDRVIE